jgi:hypothetical protein
MANRSDRRSMCLGKFKAFEAEQLIRPERADFHQGLGR